MKSESAAIERLTNIQSEVSTHYFIKNNGKIEVMVPDLFIAWHAGKSRWKNLSSLNDYSIGIEISNPGHEFKYRNFSKKQISSLVKLCSFLMKKYKIFRGNILGHSDIAPDRKKDPGEKFPWKKLSRRRIGYWHNFKKEYLSTFRNVDIDKRKQKLFFKNIIRIGYNKSFYRNLYKRKMLIKAFQRRFRQELVNGKIDEEMFIISKKLVNIINKST